MRVVEVLWEPAGRRGWPGATCSGTTTAQSTGREMGCSQYASTWRVLILNDGTQLPKPYCDLHRSGDRWAEYEASQPRIVTIP